MKHLTLLAILLLAGCGGAGPTTVKVQPSSLPSQPVMGTLIIAGRTALARAFVSPTGVKIEGPGPDILLPLSDVVQGSPLRVAWKVGDASAEFVQ